MKKTILIALMCSAMACQKEISIDTNQPGMASHLTGRLQKEQVFSMPQDQLFLEHHYEYDINGRVTRITTIYLPGGSSVVRTGTAAFARDAQGRTSSILYAPGTEATRAVLTYRGTTNNLDYVVLQKNQGSADIVVDSMVFTYNAQDQLERTDQYYRQSNGQLKKTGYQEYRWDARGNLLSKQTYQDDDSNGQFEASIKYSWEYDEKQNPRYSNDPAIFYWSYLWPTGGSVGNVTRQLNHYPANGGPDDELSYIFQYNADNRPVLEIKNPGGTTVTKYIYYQ